MKGKIQHGGARAQEDGLMKASTATKSEKCLKCMDLAVDGGLHGAAFDSTVPSKPAEDTESVKSEIVATHHFKEIDEVFEAESGWKEIDDVFGALDDIMEANKSLTPKFEGLDALLSPFSTPTSPLPSCPASTGKTVLIVQSNGTYTAVHQWPSQEHPSAGRAASAIRSRLGNLLSVSLTCEGDERMECLLSCGTCASESTYISQMTTPGSVSAVAPRNTKSTIENPSLHL